MNLNMRSAAAVFSAWHLLGQLLSGCSSPSTAPQDDVRLGEHGVTFVHGDPMNLIAGAARQPETFFQASALETFSDFSLTLLTVYAASSQKADTTSSGVLALVAPDNAVTADRSAPGGSGMLDVSHYRLVAADKGYYYYMDPTGQGKMSILLAPSSRGDGSLEVKRVNNVDVEVLHYSRRPDGRAFSLLAKNSGPLVEGSALIAIFFVKNETPSAPIPAPKPAELLFNYLLGAGIKNVWQDRVDLKLCGESPYDAFVTQALSRWDAADGANDNRIGSLPVTLTKLTNPSVFTDLNQICIRFVDNFLFEKSDSEAVMGLTSIAVSPTTHVILGADILISLRGIQKLAGNMDPLPRTLAHEMGHLFGLDHVFDGRQSIMSYNPADVNISTLDSSAILNLYPQVAAQN